MDEVDAMFSAGGPQRFRHGTGAGWLFEFENTQRYRTITVVPMATRS